MKLQSKLDSSRIKPFKNLIKSNEKSKKPPLMIAFTYFVILRFIVIIIKISHCNYPGNDYQKRIIHCQTVFSSSNEP
jgi:hypothetical protein